jgi:hypothetical protein
VVPRKEIKKKRERRERKRRKRERKKRERRDRKREEMQVQRSDCKQLRAVQAATPSHTLLKTYHGSGGAPTCK